jgi:hypothetical protein
MDGFFSTGAQTLNFESTPGRLNDAIEFQLANTAEARQHAYKIRHDAYLSYNYIVPRETGQFSDKYDDRQNVATVLVFKGGEPAATVRVCLFDPRGRLPDADRVPAMEIFENEIRSLTSDEQGRGRLRAVEITRLARRCDLANDKAVIAALFRAVGYLILAYDADIVLNACRPHHIPMYRRFGFRKIEEPRQYPNLTYKAALLACFRSAYDEAQATLPFLHGISVHDDAYERLLDGELVEVSDRLHADNGHLAPVSRLNLGHSRTAGQSFANGLQNAASFQASATAM